MIGRASLLAPLLRTAWPDGLYRILALAASAPVETARESWLQWRSLDRLDEASWQEQRLLACVSRRLGDIDPEYPHRGRLAGLIRAHWTASQLKARHAMTGVDLLLQAEVPVMLFKGRSIDLPGQTNLLRISADLDVLVPRARYRAALEILQEAGWKLDEDSARRLEQAPLSLHGVNLKNAFGGDFDVHQQPIAGAVSDRALDGIWSRAVACELHGRRVLTAAPEDVLAIVACHGVGAVWHTNANALWALDFLSGLNTPGLTPERLSHAARSLDRELEMRSALLYCAEVLASPVARTFVAATPGVSWSVLPYLRFVAHAPLSRRGPRWLVTGVMRRAFARQRVKSRDLPNGPRPVSA